MTLTVKIVLTCLAAVSIVAGAISVWRHVRNRGLQRIIDEYLSDDNKKDPSQ